MADSAREAARSALVFDDVAAGAIDLDTYRQMTEMGAYIPPEYVDYLESDLEMARRAAGVPQEGLEVTDHDSLTREFLMPDGSMRYRAFETQDSGSATRLTFDGREIGGIRQVEARGVPAPAGVDPRDGTVEWHATTDQVTVDMVLRDERLHLIREAFQGRREVQLEVGGMILEGVITGVDYERETPWSLTTARVTIGATRQITRREEEVPTETPVQQVELFDSGVDDAEVSLVHLTDIEPIEEEAPERLVASVGHYGVLHSVVLVDHGEAGEGEFRYEVVDGRRRVAAARAAGHFVVPAVVHDGETNPGVQAGMTLSANLHRSNNPIAELEAIERLVNDGGYTAREVAEQLGLSTAQVENRLRLRDLRPFFRRQVRQGRMSARAAREVVRLDVEALDNLTRTIQGGDYHWSARRIRETFDLDGPEMQVDLVATGEGPAVEIEGVGFARVYAALEIAIEAMPDGTNGAMSQADQNAIREVAMGLNELLDMVAPYAED